MNPLERQPRPMAFTAVVVVAVVVLVIASTSGRRDDGHGLGRYEGVDTFV